MAFAGLAGWEIIVLSAMFFIFLVCGIAVVWWWSNKKKWPFKVNLFQNIAGAGYVPTKKYRARLISSGDDGLEVFYIKGINKIKPAYGKRIGTNTIAWAEGPDGYWYNITFGDLNLALLKLGVVPTDKNIRYGTNSLRKGFAKAYREQSFAEKWGVPLTIGLLILAIIVFGIVMYFLFQKSIEVANVSGQTATTLKETGDILNKVLARLDNIRTGASPI